MTTANTTIHIPAVTIELQPGERYSGAMLAAEGRVLHHLILLPARPAKRGTWDEQMAWAASVGGDLPSPQEQFLLLANCEDQLPDAVCWSNKEYEGDASCAWLCHFINGYQGTSHKSYELSAVAVRRLIP